MVGTNRQGEAKKSIRNGEAKELICTTHGHKLRGWGVGGAVMKVGGSTQGRGK